MGQAQTKTKGQFQYNKSIYLFVQGLRGDIQRAKEHFTHLGLLEGAKVYEVIASASFDLAVVI